MALKSSSGVYYLNGHWNIQDTGKYDAGGTKVFYARRNQKDQLRAIGPTKEDLHVLVSNMSSVKSSGGLQQYWWLAAVLAVPV